LGLKDFVVVVVVAEFLQAQRETSLHPGGVAQIGRSSKWSGKYCYCSLSSFILETSLIIQPFSINDFEHTMKLQS